MKQICDDLAAEHAALDAIVADLSEDQWHLITPAEGWDVADNIAHILSADQAGLMAAVDPAGFEVAKQALLSGKAGFDSAFGERPAKTGEALLAQWRTTRKAMLEAFAAHEPKDRLPWFGPSMSALSFATARLMETWAHGQDVAATLHRPIEPTARLRHVAHIGVTTRGWSYANRGLPVPEGVVRVELTAPDGELWTWGPADAADVVSGSAEEFCLVVTQRRPLEATGLVARGPLAEEWMSYAQAFAGPPTNTATDRG